MSPSAKRLAERFLRRTAENLFPLELRDGPILGTEAWVSGAWAGKIARDQGLLPDPPDDRPSEFYEGYTWGYKHAPRIREVE